MLPCVLRRCVAPARTAHPLRRAFSSSTSSFAASGSSASDGDASTMDPSRFVKFVTPGGEESFGILKPSSEPSAPRRAKIVKMDGGGKLHFAGETDVEMLLPPVDPPTIFAIGLNYKKHVAETGMPAPDRPVVTMKAVSSLTGHETAIIIPAIAQSPMEVDFEGELAVVIGKPCRNVTVADALDYVMGYTIANDVTARRWQGKKGGNQWVLSKSFDTFCPLGPFLIPAREVRWHCRFSASPLHRRILAPC